jgi:hypothetical protein
MVPDTPDVELVLTGPNGVLSELKPGTVVIDMSTISPVVTKKLSGMVAAKGGSMLDAPVSGGEIGAKNATLTIMVGGDEKDVRARASDPRVHGEARERHLYRRLRRRTGGQAVQPDLHRRRAGRRRRRPLRREEPWHRSFARTPGAAWRVRVEQGARSPRAAHADRRLQAGVFTRLYQKDLRLVNETAMANNVAMPRRPSSPVRERARSRRAEAN